MREIIDLLESVGLANRKPGDRFANDQGQEIIFNDLTFYPESGAFPDDTAMKTAIDQVSGQIGVSPEQIVWSNDGRGARAFGIAHFVDDNNKDYYLGRYYRSISPNRSENSFPNILPGGFRLQTRAARKEQTGYKPTEVLTDLTSLTPDSIYQQIVTKFGENSDEANATRLFMAADSFPLDVPQGNMNPTAFTDYFCEMLQPMALVMGKPVKGNANQAEEIFLTDGGFSECVISFGASATGGLSDSMLSNDAGQSIILSSKAKSGATASAGNLKDQMDKVRDTPAGDKLLKSHAKAVSILDMIVDGGYINGPLNLAQLFGMISKEEADQVRALRKFQGDPVAQGRLTDNLAGMYQERGTLDSSRVVPFYHMLAAIAHRVADHVNRETEFSSAASAILNQGALVQMYTETGARPGVIVIKGFTTVYPSQAVTDVMLRAGKTYYSTGNKGNFTFEILKNGATAADDSAVSQQTDTKPDVDLDQISQKRADVRARRDSGDEKNLGRKRRR